jgi:hypothetical protein
MVAMGPVVYSPSLARKVDRVTLYWPVVAILVGIPGGLRDTN